MQIVIEIDEGVYEDWKWAGKYASLSYAQRIILDGKPLPKGHGKIIDSNEFNHYLIGRDSSFKALIAEIPSIIEADKESEECNSTVEKSED